MAEETIRPSHQLIEPALSESDYYKWLAEFCARAQRGEVESQFVALGEEAEPRSLDQSTLQREKEIFENSARSLRRQFEESRFWKEKLWPALIDKHHAAEGLLAHPANPPAVLSKPWSSLLLKSYRRNVLDNPQFPSPPGRGWTLPQNWLDSVRDIVRTTIVVRYLDGIEIVRRTIEEVGASLDVGCDFDYENREEGYYALHVTARCPFRFRSEEGYKSQVRLGPVEIQVCTQVQEVLRALTHRSYEASRRRPRAESDRWQWRWQCDQFTPNYLGHILHYADGVMLSLRNRPSRR